jgi:hypothetical protein
MRQLWSGSTLSHSFLQFGGVISDPSLCSSQGIRTVYSSLLQKKLEWMTQCCDTKTSIVWLYWLFWWARNGLDDVGKMYNRETRPLHYKALPEEQYPAGVSECYEYSLHLHDRRINPITTLTDSQTFYRSCKLCIGRSKEPSTVAP